MKTTLHSLRREKKINYSNYQFAMALYTIIKRESKKEAKLPARDFRNHTPQKEHSTAGLKQKLGRFVLAITTAIASNFSTGKQKPVILKLHDTI